MQHSLTIHYTPLPQCPVHELRMWRNAFEAELAHWLGTRQWEHVHRFGRDSLGREAAGLDVMKAALSRLLARALCITSAALHGVPQQQLRMDDRGRPVLEGWLVAFSHSGQAAFCAMAPAGQAGPALGLDAEALASTPPHASAFAEHELSAPKPLAQECANREALRRWTIKEAMLKAAGLGLGMQPALIPTGRFGQRAGLWRGPLGQLGWRTLACPGHWLCVAQAGHVPSGRIVLQAQNLRTLLQSLADLQQ